MSKKADRDALTDPDGKSSAYQASTPSVAKRLDAIQKRANKYLTKTVSTIIGDLKTAGIFSSKQSAYNWLKKTPNMSAVQALVAQAQAMPDKAKRDKLMAKINAGAKVYRANRLEALNMALDINKAIIKEGVVKNVAPLLYMTAEDAFSRQTFTLQKQVGIGWALDSPQGAQVVKGMNSTLDKMTEWYHGKLDDQIRDKIVEGMMEGKSNQQIARDLKQMGLPPARAKAVAKTMITTVSNEAEAEALNQAGIEMYEYVATLDERTCPVCGGLDGRTFTLKSARAGYNFPPMHPNCRCTHIASLRDDIKEELTRSAVDEMGRAIKVPANMTYVQWRKQYLKKPMKPHKQPEFKQGIKVVPTFGQTPAKATKKLPAKPAVEPVKPQPVKAEPAKPAPKPEPVPVAKPAETVAKTEVKKEPAWYEKDRKVPTRERQEITSEDFDSKFRGYKEDQWNATEKALSETIGARPDADPNAIAVIKNLSRNRTTTHLKVEYSDDNFIERNLFAPTLSIPDATAEGSMNTHVVSVTLHEMTHLSDFFHRPYLNDTAMLSRHRQGLTQAIDNNSAVTRLKKGEKFVADDVQEMFKEFHRGVDANRREKDRFLAEMGVDDMDIEAHELKEKLDAGWYSGEEYDDKFSEYNRLRRRSKELKEVAKRRKDNMDSDLVGGCMDQFEDIIDALSSGSASYNRMVYYGHGRDYYKDAGKREAEIIANYNSLSIMRPDLVQLLRRDYPDLCDELDKIIYELGQDVEQ